jgi:cytochrome b pre-mRNA-processing protein 3
MMATASTDQKSGLLARLSASLRGRGTRDMSALYASVVAEARQPHWYLRHGVPDTIDGRFDMVALVLSLALLRLENAHCEAESVYLTERFVDDMDGQIREIGFGDLVVGKQIGGIMAVLGGRLGVYRDGIAAATLTRTLWRGNPPDDVVGAVAEIEILRAHMAAVPVPDFLRGRLT